MKCVFKELGDSQGTALASHWTRTWKCSELAKEESRKDMTCVSPAGASLLWILWNKCLDRKQKSNQSVNIWFQILVLWWTQHSPQENVLSSLLHKLPLSLNVPWYQFPFYHHPASVSMERVLRDRSVPWDHRDFTANPCLAWLHWCFNSGLPKSKTKG